MNHHDPAADSAGVWVVTEQPPAAAPPLDALRLTEDNELSPATEWIQRAMRCIRRMHQDEAVRQAVADRLF